MLHNSGGSVRPVFTSAAACAPQEVPGEDPTLTSAYAAAFVTGLQGDRAPARPNGALTIAACCKHFLANSLESWHGHTRHNFDAKVPTRDLVDYYLPAFKSCIMEGRAQGVMCSYNAVNGVPMCANSKYLKDTLRGTWGFRGYVTSDCDAVGDVSAPAPGGHGYANATEGAALSLRAGTDMDCGDWGAHAYLKQLPAAVAAGLATEDDLDVALRRLTTIQMKLGLFDRKDDQPLFQLGIGSVRKPEHTALALEGARQSITLLRNAGGTLPLPLKLGGMGSMGEGEEAKASAIKTIAVLGPHMNAQRALVSNYVCGLVLRTMSVVCCSCAEHGSYQVVTAAGERRAQMQLFIQ